MFYEQGGMESCGNKGEKKQTHEKKETAKYFL